MNKKETGSYYTPDYLAKFISKRVFSHFDNNSSISVFEPSVGDGKFIEAIKATQNQKNIFITGLDIEKDELKKAKKIWTRKGSIFKNIDFLDFKTAKKYSIIIGNPPYIKRNRLTQSQKKKCKEIHLAENLSDTSIKNIWTSFLIKSTSLLDDNGILAFVLPLELLQVKFTEEIRKFLREKFQRLEIFTFDDLMFECKGQDTLVLIAYKKSNTKGVCFSHIKDKKQLDNEDFKLDKNEILINSKIKWTHHDISSDDLSFLKKLKSNLKKVTDYCDSKPGIVTAANAYFIVNKETENKYKLQEYTVPIIQKGLFVNGSVVFSIEDFNKLEKSNSPTRFIRFKNEHKNEFSQNVLEYLELGKAQKIHERYKCKRRENWFVVPNVASQPEGFFLKRSHLYPKIIKNSANAFVTDSAYKIEVKNDYNINSLIYSFYNSLTLTFAELEGRYYGGGVLELVPSEFKALPLPYKDISSKDFQKYQRDFEKKENIEVILKMNDCMILNSILNLSIENIKRISIIRQKLIAKRLRK